MVLVLKQNLIILRKPFDGEAALLLRKLLCLTVLHRFRNLRHSYERDFIGEHFTWNKHFVIGEIGPVILYVELLQNVNV